MEIETISWPVKWDIGASNLRTKFNLDQEELLITYRIAPIDAKFDDEFATVRFTKCQSFRFHKMRYDLNALKKHQYFEMGLEHFEAHKINRSDWLEMLKALNPDGNIESLNHYLLSFKDELLEVIASDFELVERGRIDS